MSSKPPWWRAFDKLERAIGEPLENAAASNRYVDVMVRGMRVQRAIGGGIGRLAGGAAGRVLRAASIPTRSDVRRLNRQLAVLTSEVRALSIEQREGRGDDNEQQEFKRGATAGSSRKSSPKTAGAVKAVSPAPPSDPTRGGAGR